MRVRSLNEVIGVVRIGLKSLGFFLHAFLDFQDGRRLRLILQTKNKREWLSTDALFFFSFSFSFIFYLLSFIFIFLFSFFFSKFLLARMSLFYLINFCVLFISLLVLVSTVGFALHVASSRLTCHQNIQESDSNLIRIINTRKFSFSLSFKLKMISKNKTKTKMDTNKK